MRKTNKQSTRLADDKKGVILVTILFIVAVALIFITTSLMISISARQRIYSNAKSDQARLTVTSLSQSIWQAIYSQQLSDSELIELAKANTLIRFTSADVPGMTASAPGTPSTTEATAFFYTIGTDASGNPNKIGIECKCSIDGETQYYTLVVKKNASEGIPQPMFQMTVELGNPGMFNSFNVGVDAHRIDTTSDQNRRRQWEYRLPDGTIPADNIIFLNGDATSNRDGSGFYSRVIATGHCYLRNAVFTDDVFFVGQDAVFDFQDTSSLNAPMSGAETRRGNAYFWGTNRPFATTQPNATTTMNTFDDIYFDYRATDDPAGSLHLNTSSTGFTNEGGYTIDGTPYLRGYNGSDTFSTPWNINGNVYYEAGGSGAYLTSAPSSWEHFNNGTDKVPNISQYLTVQDSQIDTQSEVVATYGKSSDHPEAGEITSATSALTVGYYYINGATISQPIDCDVSGGNIIIYVKGSFDIKNGGCFYVTSAASVEHNLIFVLENNANITVYTNDASKTSGFVDRRCFGSTEYTYANLNQTTIPRIYIFSTYSSSTALTLGDTATNGGVVCTAFLGFFPSTTRGSDGATLELNNVASGTGMVYYGRIACGSIPNNTNAGGNLNIPYCPSIPGQIDYRSEAYRDNTDFSVVTDECGYFTA